MATDSEGDAYVACFFAGTIDVDPGPGVDELTSKSDSSSLFLAKYAPDGSLLWAGQVNASSRLRLTTDNLGNLYLTGAFTGSVDFDLGRGHDTDSSTLNGTSGSSAFIAKYTPDGVLTWARSFANATTYSGGTSVAVDTSGNVYSCGYFSGGAIDLDPGPGAFLQEAGPNNESTYISKLDSSGNFIWGEVLATDTGGQGIPPTQIAVDGSQNVYLMGEFRRTVDFDPGPGTTWRSEVVDPSNSFTTQKMYVLKLNPSGSFNYVVAANSTEGVDYDNGTGIVVDSAGNAYVAGSYWHLMEIEAPDGSIAASLTATPENSQSGFIMRLDSSGELSWAQNAVSGISAIAYDGSSNLFVTGTVELSECSLPTGVHLAARHEREQSRVQEHIGNGGQLRKRHCR